MRHPVSIVRLALQGARDRVAADPQLPIYGALSFACRELERNDPNAIEALYKSAKNHLDQAERLFVLDVALQLLPEEKKNG